MAQVKLKAGGRTHVRLLVKREVHAPLQSAAPVDHRPLLPTGAGTVNPTQPACGVKIYLGFQVFQGFSIKKNMRGRTGFTFFFLPLKILNPACMRQPGTSTLQPSRCM